MFSIIIPTLNNLEYLKFCIKSIKRNSKLKNEIITHVNIGDDGTIDFLQQEKIDFTHTDYNSGICEGINKAAKLAKFNYMLYAHDDFYFCPNWDEILEKEVKKIGHNNFYISGTMMNKGQINFNCGETLNDFDEKKFLEVEKVKGFAMIINNSNDEKILFDENIFLYLEEIDLCRRVKEKKGRILLLNIEVKHLGGLSHGNRDDSEMENSRNWHWMWSKFYFYKKHHNYFYSLIRTFPNLLSSIFKFIYFRLIDNEKKTNQYKMRFLGLLNSYLLKKSFYRPYKKN